MKYLKKKKMYELVKPYFANRIPLMKNCNYSFVRGSEFLKFNCVDNYNSVSVYSSYEGLYVRVHEYKIDENDFKVEVDDFFIRCLDPKFIRKVC